MSPTLIPQFQILLVFCDCQLELQQPPDLRESDADWVISEVMPGWIITRFRNSDPNTTSTCIPQHGRLLVKTANTRSLPLKHTVKFAIIQ